jgi:enoyl-[acyl-carrier protein] reductase I
MEKARAAFGEIDILVHAIAFAGRDELSRPYYETSRAGFQQAMDISVYSFTALAREALPLMRPGGAMITLTYHGSVKAVTHYNVMGVAKAALEASMRYMARDLGPEGIRVNAVSAGAMRTLAIAGIQGGRGLIATGREWSVMKEDTSMEGIAGCALWLLSDLGRSTTGEVVHVDAGFHIVGVPNTGGE